LIDSTHCYALVDLLQSFVIIASWNKDELVIDRYYKLYQLLTQLFSKYVSFLKWFKSLQ